MDLYVLELDNRIKVGRSKNVKKRMDALLPQAGIKKSEILNLYSFAHKGKFEQKIHHVLKKQNTNGEWFSKEGLTLNFLHEIKQENEIDDNLIIAIQVEKECQSEKQRALAIFEKIRKERKGIGYPMSPNINSIIKTKKVPYRNMIYHLSDDFSEFRRELKFDTHSMSSSQVIECLRIYKNNKNSESEKQDIQLLIDDVFKFGVFNDREIYIAESLEC